MSFHCNCGSHFVADDTAIAETGQSIQTQTLTLDDCRDWYESRYYDWEDPINPLSIPPERSAMCSVFHSKILETMYSKEVPPPEEIVGDIEANCATPRYDPNETEGGPEAEYKFCMADMSNDHIAHKHCLSKSISFFDRREYIQCRTDFQVANEPDESNRSLCDIENRISHMQRTMNQSYVMRWYKSAFDFNPKLACAGSHLGTTPQNCTIVYSKEPSPVEIWR